MFSCLDPYLPTPNKYTDAWGGKSLALISNICSKICFGTRNFGADLGVYY